MGFINKIELSFNIKLIFLHPPTYSSGQKHENENLSESWTYFSIVTTPLCQTPRKRILFFCYLPQRQPQDYSSESRQHWVHCVHGLFSTWLLQHNGYQWEAVGQSNNSNYKNINKPRKAKGGKLKKEAGHTLRGFMYSLNMSWAKRWTGISTKGWIQMLTS